MRSKNSSVNEMSADLAMAAAQTRVPELPAFDGETKEVDEKEGEIKPFDEYGVAWWDATLKISEHDWLRLTDVQPDEAALLLSGIDPDTVSDLKALLARRSEAGLSSLFDGDSFEMVKRLYHLFSRKSGDPGPRSLRMWSGVAAEKAVPIHEWFDRFVLSVPETELEVSNASPSVMPSPPSADGTTGVDRIACLKKKRLERAKRLLKRQRELQASGVRNYTGQVAMEEGISLTRMGQLLREAIANEASTPTGPAGFFRWS